MSARRLQHVHKLNSPRPDEAQLASTSIICPDTVTVGLQEVCVTTFGAILLKDLQVAREDTYVESAEAYRVLVWNFYP